jgi:chromosome segregation protein
MRISKIKLAGFKSFVDPTTLTLPGNLTGVVGPNGCGKSNIIDAVNWVMGESSAKHLRGDSMADVVFNGSNTRQPVGQAFVEIILDNADGAIGGQYAGYGEISIKRTVSRDGISIYQLNGVRCRRKDVTSLFLGTGLGSRSYSVIEQGMITRVIEAKPEDLRVFLEEAAGISKYKERRRETENRIRHTNDNISRLNDIRDELANQLSHLERQSRAAERYQELKAQERSLKAESLAIRWRDVDRDALAGKRELTVRETALEQTLAELRAVDAEMIRLRDAQSAETERFNEVQAAYYGVGAEISRLEQSIQHTRDRREQLQRDLAQARATESDAEQHIAKEEAASGTCAQDIEAMAPELERAQAAEQNAYATLDAREQAMQSWQSEWDEFNRRAAESTNTEQVARTRLEHLQEDVDDGRRRMAALRAQLEDLDPEALQRKIHDLELELRQGAEEHERLLEDLQRRQGREREIRARADALGEALHETRDACQEVRARIASLEALQQAAMGADREAVEAWLAASGLAEAPRMAAELQVEPGWERALEAAIRIPLDAIRVNALERIVGPAADLPAGGLTLFEAAGPPVPAPRHARATPLIDKVRAPWPLERWLAGVYAVESLAEAFELRGELQTFERVVTRDGYLLGAGWLRLRAPAETGGGVLQREQALKARRAEVRDLEQALARDQERLDELKRELASFATAPGPGAALEAAKERIALLRSELAAGNTRLEHELDGRARLEQELSALEDQIALDLETVESVSDHLEGARSRAGSLESERTGLIARRDAIREALQGARDAWRNARDAVHAMTLRVETMRSRRAALDQSLERHRELLLQARGRCDELSAVLASLETPLAERRRDLDAALGQRLEVEARLAQARERLQEVDQSLRQAESGRGDIEQRLQQRREALEAARIEARALEVRLQDLEEQFRATGAELRAVLESLPAERTEQECLAELERLDRRIQRLGPINLAAIDEFSQLSERKEYLDRQHADLTEALETLENAIRKIDRETRTRFKETYDRVNSQLQRIFPILFGGGHAYLELTGTDLLETGVTVMARPPGKRNSTIHLLSGGEKALTALALVFAIFELNPAPFCLLDEVDAPLDDANVYRFCDLVKSMAHAVQFVLVTHNKITMEIADQLIGVTMQEAGVSRLVAVDMEQAVGMAATA